MGVLLRIVAVLYVAAAALMGLANFGSLSAEYPKPLIVAIGVLAVIPAVLLYAFGQVVTTVRQNHKELVLIRKLLATPAAQRDLRAYRPTENGAARIPLNRASSPHAVARFRQESEEAGLDGKVFEGVPWRQLPDGSINGLIADRLVRFRDWREFAATVQRR
ncbi:hypothetical protein IZ6_02190 [Terrihabitans soli]|uniref:Uncharacterized protein n=2 Tax=Terrihabitans soli TaxID=708113 RepID=A0A6S6QH69_9HYPH|nr:hypothetical protein IZ6_02190 [Terrihabitans soli]